MAIKKSYGFVRSCKSRGNTSYRWVRNTREGNKVVQEHLLHLGADPQCSTVEGAVSYWKGISNQHAQKIASLREERLVFRRSKKLVPKALVVEIELLKVKKERADCKLDDILGLYRHLKL